MPSRPSGGSRRTDRSVTGVAQLWGRVTDRVRSAARGGTPPAIAALDIGTEFAKALVVTVERDFGGRLIGTVRGTGRTRQGLAHMQSGTVSDIDAVVANCRVAMDEARAMAELKPMAAVIGIAGELVKGTTATLATRRDDPRRPLDEPELDRLVRRAQDHALREAEERIRWESGVDRLEVRLVHAAIVEMTIDGYPGQQPSRLHRFPGRARGLQRLRADGPSRRAPGGGRCAPPPAARRHRRALRGRHLPRIRASWATPVRCSSTSAAARPTSPSSAVAG